MANPSVGEAIEKSGVVAPLARISQRSKVVGPGFIDYQQRHGVPAVLAP
jgi:hypothetical protein